MSTKNSHLLETVLGVVIGVLLVVTVQKVFSPKDGEETYYKEWEKVNLVLKAMSDNYVDSVDFDAVSEAAINAALSKLDPHSIYMPPVTLEESETELAGNFDGIGIQFNVPNDTAIVLEVISGGPSEKIGLQAGDRIIKVGEEVIAGVNFPQDSMVRRMKGPAGTKVLITVNRDGVLIPFEITRGKIPVNSVDAYFMIQPELGYLRLSKFSRTSTEEVALACIDLLDKGMKHLIFDLRDNTGGYLDQALNLTNLFLEEGSVLVYMEGLNYSRQEYKADGNGFLQDLGLTVLINESSASSSEIFAGAIQDNDRGVIIGRRSYGKGLVQEPIIFSDGSGIRLTMARFHTPSGRCIQKPYDDYAEDILHRIEDGELWDADSIKVNKDDVYYTKNGREVYGGGGIIPDVFVPLDTTRATNFHIGVNRKVTAMRFASYYFDKKKQELSSIDDFDVLTDYLNKESLEDEFLKFAREVDGIRPSSASEWEETAKYLMPQVRALVGRYSKLGDNAFYRYYAEIDDVILKAVDSVQERLIEQ